MENLEKIIIPDAIEKRDLDYIFKKTQREFRILGGKRVLFTGAGGFLGYYFIKSIINWNDLNPKRKIILYALDTFSAGIPNWIPKRPDLIILKKDITKYKPSGNEFFDYIIHAASIASPTFYRKHPIETINANVLGLYNLLDYMVKRQKTKRSVKGFLFFSTSEIYGDPIKGNIPTSESYRGNVSCTGPRACYDESKRFGETLCVNYTKVHHLPIKTVRPFNNYGPGLKITDRRVIPDLANNILRGKDITLLSEGSATRTFCYVADAIAGYFKALVRGKPGEAYNIGVEKPEISMFDLAKRMRKLAIKHLGYKGRIVRRKSPEENYLTDNPQRRCPLITKARKELGYRPQISLNEGLANTLLWYKVNKS